MSLPTILKRVRRKWTQKVGISKKKGCFVVPQWKSSQAMDSECSFSFSFFSIIPSYSNSQGQKSSREKAYKTLPVITTLHVQQPGIFGHESGKTVTFSSLYIQVPFKSRTFYIQKILE